MRIALAKLGASIVVLLAPITSVAAQSLSPMRAQVTSITDQFAIRVFPGNPYKKRVQIKNQSLRSQFSGNSRNRFATRSAC